MQTTCRLNWPGGRISEYQDEDDDGGDNYYNNNHVYKDVKSNDDNNNANQIKVFLLSYHNEHLIVHLKKETNW